LIAEALVRAFVAGRSGTEAASVAIVERFAADGLSVSRPWLNAGAADTYVWPERRAATRRGKT
jgi:hypothetical protein